MNSNGWLIFHYPFKITLKKTTVLKIWYLFAALQVKMTENETLYVVNAD